MQTFTSVPFKAEQGMSTIHGVAKFSSAGIVLEFESKLFGLISNGVKEAQIAVSEILDLKFRKGFLKKGAKIEIRATTLAKLNEMPNSEGKVTLKIERGDFERAQNAVVKLQRQMEHRENELPPAHTPVSLLFDAGEDDTAELPK